jgi:transposase
VKQRTLTLDQEHQQELKDTRDHDPRPYMRERAGALLKVFQGGSAHFVARHGLLKPRRADTVYDWLNRYEANGLAGLRQKPRRKRRIPP